MRPAAKAKTARKFTKREPHGGIGAKVLSALEAASDGSVKGKNLPEKLRVKVVDVYV